MIKFFNKIRRSLLSENRFSKCLIYAIGEIMLVVIGILIALQVNNWNENRKERALEIKYLKGLKVDLDKDLKSLAFMRNYRQTANKTAHKLLNSKKIEATYEAQIEFLEDYIKVHFWYEFAPNDNTFKELSNSGNLSLIQNDRIKEGLLNLESLNDDIISGRDHMRREYDKYLYDELIRYDEFSLVDFEHLTKEKTYDIIFLKDVRPDLLEQLADDANQILSNQIIRNGWKLAILNNSYILELYDRMTDQIVQIQQEIDRE